MAINDRIELKLVIDGKESLITLSDIKKEVIKVKQEAGSVTSGGGLDKQLNETAGAMENTAAAAEKLKESTQEAKQAQDQLSSANQKAKETAIPAAGSMAALELEIKQVANAMKQAVIGTDEFKAKQAELIALQTRLHNATRTATETTVAGATRMNMAIGGLGYAVGDANMFLYDFRIGMMAIGNNIPIIIEHFVAAKAAATGMGSSVKDVLIASLKGPGGLLLAINAVILAMQILPRIFGEQTEAIDEQKAALEKLTKEYESLTREQLKQRILSQRVENDLNEAKWRQSFRKTRIDVGATAQSLMGANPRIEYSIDYDKNAEKAMLKGRENLKVMEEVLFNLGEQESQENKLTQLTKQRKDLNEQNFATLVKGAQSFDQAAKYLDKEIELEKAKQGKGGKGSSADDRKKELLNQYQAEQEHIERVFELEGANDYQRLLKHQEHLYKRLDLYRLYGESVTQIEYEIAENAVRIENSRRNSVYQIQQDQLNKEKQDALDRLELAEDSKIAKLNTELAYMQEELELRKKHGQDIVQLEMMIQAKIQAIRLGLYRQDQQQDDENAKQADENRKDQLQKETQDKQQKLAITQNFLNASQGMFAQNTAAYKLLAIARAIMDVYVAANSSLKDAPFPFNLLGYSTIIAQGLASVTAIRETKIPGYALGGVVVGENGPEVITPMQDYASGWGQIIAATTKAVERSLRYGNNDSRVQQHEFRIKGRDLVTTAKRDEEGMLKKRW